VVAAQQASGLPPAYLPKDEREALPSATDEDGGAS